MIRFVFFMLRDVSESNPDEAIVLPNTAAPMRFNASQRLILFLYSYYVRKSMLVFMCCKDRICFARCSDKNFG